MRERMRRSLAAVAVSAMLATAPQASSALVPLATPVQLVVLGDSLGLGTGASDPANGFAFRIYRAIAHERPGSEVTNHAIGGSRAADVARLQVPQLDPKRTDVVLVIVGGNDVVRRTPVAAFGRDYRRLLAGIRQRVPSAVLVVCGVPDVARSPLFADSAAKTEALARADDRSVRAAAAQYDAAFVDLFAFTRSRGTNPDFFSNDDFHPSDAGYALLAQAALPVVEQALRPKRTR